MNGEALFRRFARTCRPSRAETAQESDIFAKIERLADLHQKVPAGIGAEFATVLTRKVFYRPFQNRRQVASYVGLTPVGARPDYRYDVAAGGAPSLCCAAAITSGAGNLAQKRE